MFKVRIFYFLLLIIISAGCSDELKEVKETYPDGSLKAKYYIDKDSLKQKSGVIYLENGNWLEVSFLDDSLNGEAYEYYKDGVLKKKTNYIRNYKHGWELGFNEKGVLIDSLLYDQGTDVKYKSFYENGTLKKDAHVKLFNEDSLKEYMFYNHDGSLRSTIWKNFNNESSFYLKMSPETGEVKEFRLVDFEYDIDSLHFVVYGTKESIDSIEVNYIHSIDVNIDSVLSKGLYFKYVETQQTGLKDPKNNMTTYSFYNSEGVSYKSKSGIINYKLGSERFFSIPRVANDMNQIIEVKVYSRGGQSWPVSSSSKLLRVQE